MLKGRREGDTETKVLGIVVNAYDIKKGDTYYYKFYSYYPSNKEESQRQSTDL